MQVCGGGGTEGKGYRAVRSVTGRCIDAAIAFEE